MMKSFVTLMAAGAVAVLVGAGCKTTDGCCGPCAKDKPAMTCGACSSEVAACATCGKDKAACTCGVEATK